MTDAPGDQADQNSYPGSMVVAAVLATIFFPLISLIVSLVLMSRQQNERKRAQVRAWAWLTVGWLALELVVVLVFFVAVGSSGS